MIKQFVFKELEINVPINEIMFKYLNYSSFLIKHCFIYIIYLLNSFPLIFDQIGFPFL